MSKKSPCQMKENKKEEANSKEKTLIKLFASGLAIFILLFIAYYIYSKLGLNELKNREKLQEYIASFGMLAPLLFILVSFLQVSFVPIPGSVTIIAGVYLFGVWGSFIYSYIGMMIGSIVAFYLGRLLGRPFVNYVAGGKEKVDKILERIKNKQNVVLFFAFLLPFFPDDLLCSVCGILTMGFPLFLLMQIITRATSILATIFFMSGSYIPYNGWGIPVLIAIGILAIVAFIISYRYSERIESFFISKLSRKKKK